MSARLKGIFYFILTEIVFKAYRILFWKMFSSVPASVEPKAVTGNRTTDDQETITPVRI